MLRSYCALQIVQCQNQHIGSLAVASEGLQKKEEPAWPLGNSCIAKVKMRGNEDL